MASDFGRVLPRGELTSRVAVIGDYPSQGDAAVGAAFSDKRGSALIAHLRALGIADSDVYMDCAIRRTLRRDESENSRKIHAIVDAGDGVENLAVMPNLKAVLLLGEAALYAVTGWKGIANWHGSVMNRGDFARRSPLCNRVLVVPCFHPRDVLGNPQRPHLLTFMQTLEKLRRCLSDATRPTRPMPEIAAVTEHGVITRATRLWRRVVCDTEYGENGVPWLVGLADADAPTNVLSVRNPALYADELRELFNRAKETVMHHAPADVAALEKIGVPVPATCRIVDTLQLHALLEPDLHHSLSFVARTTLTGICEWKYMRGDALNGEWYNALDVCYTGLVAEKLRDDMTAAGLWEVYDNEVEPNILRMADIERVGIRIDLTQRDKLREKLRIEAAEAFAKAQELTAPEIGVKLDNMQRRANVAKAAMKDDEERIRNEERGALTCGHEPALKSRSKKCPRCGEAFDRAKRRIADLAPMKKMAAKLAGAAKRLESKRFNPASPDDLRWYVCEVLKVKTGKRTDTGKASVDMKTLRKFAHDPVIHEVWKGKHADKLRSTFVEVAVDERGVTHPPVRMHGTGTGRPASGRDKNGEEEKSGNEYAYNAFNIPEKMRVIYVPDPGDAFVNLDFKDLEGRLMGLYSADPMMCKLFSEGRDRHGYLAAKVYGIDEKEAKKVMIRIGASEKSARSVTKTVAHGIPYGMKPEGVARNLQIPPQEAVRVYKQFFLEFPLVGDFQQALLRHVFDEGNRMLRTAFNRRRRYLGEREVQENEALAQPAQGGGASVWYRSVEKLCEPRSLKLRIGFGRFVIGTYDSFLLSVPKGREEEAAAWAAELLSRPLPALTRLPGASLMPVGLPVDWKTGSEYSFGEGAALLEDGVHA